MIPGVQRYDAGARSGPFRLVTVDAAAGGLLADVSPMLGEAAAAAVGARAAPPTILIIRPRPHVLLGPKDARLPALAAGVSVLRDAGFPVYRRAAGGTAVVVDQDCIVFAVARPCKDFVAVHRNFHEMTLGVRLALSQLGLDAEFGEAPGAFCAGPYDLMAHGRKIAGVAQAMRQGFALVAGVLLVSQDPAPVTALLNEFYAAAGGEPSLVTDYVAPLAGLLQRRLALDEVEEALRWGFAQAHGCEPGVLGEDEIAAAQRLLADRRLA